MQITTLAIDDVKKAFDNVPIAPLMETFAEHINDPSLLQLVETILRGGEDRGRAVGIPQGDPLSPLALNVYLHRVHDLPLEGDRDFPPLYRYADNLCYLTGSVPEGHLALDRVRRLLAHAGLALKGADGDPVDLREGGSASLLGFRLSLHEDRLRLGLGEDALEDDMALCLISSPRRPRPPPRGPDGPAGVGRVARPGPRRPDGDRPERSCAPQHGTGSASWPHGGNSRTGARRPRARWRVRYTAALTAPGTDGRGLSLRGGSASHRSTGRLITRSTPEAGCPGNAWGTRLPLPRLTNWISTAASTDLARVLGFGENSGSDIGSSCGRSACCTNHRRHRRR